MQKTAQKRSVLNKIREMSNISGIAAEKFFNPEFERVMNSLRTADNKIRAIASGKDIEGEDPGDDAISLKDLVKSAKSNLNRREYMTAIAFLGRFHKKLYKMVSIVNGLNSDVDKVHHDFLFKDLDEEHKKHLSDMKTRFATVRRYSLVSEAGIMDFLHNISSDRGKALGAWEKRYPKQVGKLKKDVANLITKSENVLSLVLSSLKEMASARATRKVDDYVKAAEKITSIYSNYDKVFRENYNSNVKGFLEKQQLVNTPMKTEDTLPEIEQHINELNHDVPDLEQHENNIPINLVPKTVQSPPINESHEDQFEEGSDHLQPLSEDAKNGYEYIMNPNSGNLTPPKLPADLVSKKNENPSETTELDKPEEILEPKDAHKKFVNSLKKMGDEKPTVIAGYIRRYAKSIQTYDFETTVKLLKLAKSIEE